jgi:hypothetical protein
MSKNKAVTDAIEQQLEAEGHSTSDDSKVMGTDFLYNGNSMPLFLDAVQSRLKNGTPPYVFGFDAGFIASALTDNIRELISDVFGNTTAAAAPLARSSKSRARRT